MENGLTTEKEAGLSVPSIGAAPGPRPSTDTPVDQGEQSTPFGPSTGISHPIPIPQKTADWESGYQNEHGPRPSRWESWVSTPLQEGAHATVSSPWGGALTRMIQEEDSKTGKMLSPDQANKLYPGRPVPYTTPIDQGVAAMEFSDREKQQALADWAAQRPTTTMGKIVSTASGFVGGITDPLNFAIGMASGGVADILAPEAAGIAGKVAAHYLANLGGFSATDALQNLIEHQMGARQKQIPEIIGENAVPAAIMTGIGVGLGAIARRYTNEGGGTSEIDSRAVKKTVAALEQDQRPPQLEDQRALYSERRAGVTQPDPGGEKIRPTLLTSPLQETPLYVAAHSDGTPLSHEHGLGPGIQLTDSHDVANNGVSRSTETPGQIAETKLPEGSKLLNIDQSAAEDYSNPSGLLRAIEEKTGLQLDTAVQSGESLKEIITNLGDWAGADLGKGKSIPEDILAQVQALAQERGFNGYSFLGEGGTNRQVHLFDSAGLEVSKSYFADPSKTPALPEEQTTQPEMQGAQPAQKGNPAMEKAQDKFYSPEIEKLAHEFRKGPTFDPYSPEALAEIQADTEQYKQQLADLAKSSDTAQKALEDLREQEAQDKRLRDLARRIAECGDGGGV